MVTKYHFQYLNPIREDFYFCEIYLIFFHFEQYNKLPLGYELLLPYTLGSMKQEAFKSKLIFCPFQ